LDYFRLPLIANSFRGDAILACVPEGGFVHGQTSLLGGALRGINPK